MKVNQDKCRYQCYHCNYRTRDKYNLTRHIERQHLPRENDGRRRSANYWCSLCYSLCESREKMQRHWANEHEINLSVETVSFKSFEKFNEWKHEFEKQEKCLYVKPCGTRKRKKKGSSYSTYLCHRDGFFRRKGKGVRNVKSKGSNKINGCCPASMKVEITAEGDVNVRFVRTHLGHDNELERLPLAKQEKDSIAKRLSLGIPFETVLDDVRNANDISERMHLLTRQDLENIVRDYGLNLTNVRQSTDFVSVEAWITQMRDTTNLVRFHKPQGALSPRFACLNENDFILIIANDAQLELLRKNGKEVVYMDGLHQNGSNLEMTTVLVIDDSGLGFPTAFMFSNRGDSEILSVFTSVLRDAIGHTLETRLFVSDLMKGYFNAWCEVMPRPLNRLYSTCHVVRNWQQNLNKIAKKEKRIHALQIVRALMQETEENVFNRLLVSALQELVNDPDTTDFGNYFASKFSPNSRSWAFCYRRQYTGVPNSQIESLNKVSKHVFLHGKRVKRLDKAIEALLKYVQDRLHHLHHQPSPKSKNSEASCIKKRHKIALNQQFSVSPYEAGFRVVQNNVHHLVSEHLPLCNCLSRCDECDICVHSYRCSCPDWFVKRNICKHIHFVAMQRKRVPVEVAPAAHHMPLPIPQVSPSNVSVMSHNSNNDGFNFDALGGWTPSAIQMYDQNQPQPVPQPVQPTWHTIQQPSCDVSAKIRKCFEMYRAIEEQLTCDEEVDVLLNALKPVLPTIQAMKNARRGISLQRLLPK
ncbi:unnamed protein product [Nesidiocoris tenuis]|uniref:SWIM-type domain-containing protein n=1 Tax=Nesidiocoris tenuis TaxID=355587 RepID=A0A6H5GKT4_9HEMI|nr:unnamed protein product [Nesidiocoris tenuis]